jgi:hypothetical protein
MWSALDSRITPPNVRPDQFREPSVDSGPEVADMGTRIGGGFIEPYSGDIAVDVRTKLYANFDG